jgi:hypothetical protein
MKNQFIARKIIKRISEKPVEAEPRALQSLAVETIARNFEIYPNLDSITNTVIIDSIYASIDLNEISIITLAQSIDNENFWKRACKETFAFSESNMLLQRRSQDNSITFKQKFFELYFQRLLKNKDVTLDFFQKLASIAGKFIKSFSIEEVPSTIGCQVFEVLSLMPNLEYFRCSFLSSSKDYSYNGEFVRGIDTERANLLVSFANFQNLQTLILENNDIDPSVLKIILKSMSNCRKLKNLSFAHNNLSNEGMRVLGKFMTKNPDVSLVKINLSDNEIGFEGIGFLSEWFCKESCQLTEINLKSNYINNQALVIILEKILKNKNSKLKRLDMGANLIRDDCGEILVDFASKNKTLDCLLLDGNEIKIGQVHVHSLHSAFENRVHLKEISLRHNQVDEEILMGLKQIN